jgi:hypothetical protein
MPDEVHEGDGRLTHPSVRSERSDASFGGVLAVIVAATVLGFITGYLVLLFFHQQNDKLEAARRSTFPLAPVPASGLPPEPRLEQVDRMEGIRRSDVHARQEPRFEQLDSYGPTKEKGYVHIPIDRAIQFLAGKLPSRPEPAGAACMAAATVVGLLGTPSGHGGLLATASHFPDRGRVAGAALERRQNGLVTAGESNSGRLFNGRKPRWQGQ